MIEKTIHYIWLGGKPEPKILQKCKKTWQKHCPDYKIVRWDESNLDVNSTIYTKQAYEAKKFAFVSDYFRFKILYENGGIYLDIDVKLLKNLDKFLDNEFFSGFEKGTTTVNPGLIMGASKGSNIVKQLLDSYEGNTFLKEDGLLDLTTVCTRTTNELQKLGLVPEDKTQSGEGWTVFASEYFCPLSYDKIEKKKTKNTHSVHLYYGSWVKPTFKSKLIWLTKKILGRKKFEKLMQKRQQKKEQKNGKNN